jgi:REP element-mobilizing transposase RayT
VAESRGWYSRGYLPHIDFAGRTQFVSWRLADALPREVVTEFKQELRHLPENEAKREFARKIEAFCDAGFGACLLRQPNVARVVQEKLFELDGMYFSLDAWVLMPNHVHVLLTPSPTADLEDLMKRTKGGSARDANRVLNRTGRLWQRDFFDRLIRDEDHLERVRRYIEWNPVKAGLCTDPRHWHCSSASPDALHRLEHLRSQRSASFSSHVGSTSVDASGPG